MAIYSLDGVCPQLPQDDACWIADNAAVIGNVIMKTNSAVWFSAVVRGDMETITIGENSNVQDCSVCHADPGFPLTIGDNVTVGHRALLHGCTIGDGTLVGMGATIMNGAVIGKNCVIGAGSLIAEGKQIPDNSLVVGAPGKVIKTFGDEIIPKLQKSADTYVKNHQRYKAGLVKLSD
jgi:carbonic anhydrase/acetyltransferase-like protein (isoleucine patch superfamily)